tara:strand:+ start:414 stop:1154 length:741 start_codon:yes stop_codon:yes gene_type:complete
MENKIFQKMLKLESSHWWFVARRKIIQRAINNLDLPRNIRILDAGCGNGDNLSLLSTFGDLVAFEKNEYALKTAKSKKIGEIYKAELPDKLPNAIKTNFDLIVLLDVLEHIDDDSKSLTTVRKLMNNKGIILITVPAFQWLWSEHDVIHHHKRRYSKSELREKLDSSGFRIKYISYFNTLLFPFALVERIGQKIFSPSNPEILELPNNKINFLLEKIFSLETIFMNKISLPFGLSLVAIAEKKNNV